MITTEQKGEILDLAKNVISNLTIELNNELKRIELTSKPNQIEDIFVNCDGIMAKLNSRIQQLKRTTEKLST